MATTPTNVPTPGLVHWLAGDLRRAAYIQLALAALFAIVSAIYWVDYRKSGTPPTSEKTEKAEDIKDLLDKDKKAKSKDKEAEKELELPRDADKKFIALWTGLLTLLFLLGALWAVAVKSEADRSVTVRLLIAVIGTSVGLVSLLLGVVVLYRSQEGLLKWLNEGEAAEGKQTIIGLLVLLASLGLIFVSVLPARAEERNDTTLRRLVYGANNLIVGILLLVVLGVANVFVGLNLPEKLDATEARFYSLDEKSVQFLKSIEQPINLYLIAETTQTGNTYRDLEALLKNCQSTNSNLKPHFLVPGPDNAAILQLYDRIKLPKNEQDEGILITLGEKEEKKSFLPLRDMVSFDQKDRAINFEGENKLITELSFLSSTDGDPVLYFTQGNGEFNLFEREGMAKARTAFKLKQALTDKKYQVKPLPFELGKKLEIPKDATAVVVLAPTRALPRDAEEPLHNYVLPLQPDQKAGKLIIVLPPVKEPNSNRIAPSGMELVLVDAGVSPTLYRLMTAPIGGRRLPLEVARALATDRGLGADHPLLRVLQDEYLFENTRTFEAVPPRNQRLQAIPFLIANPNEATWLEPNFNVDATSIAKSLFDRTNVEETTKLRAEKQLKQRRDPVGLLVSEVGQPTNPMQPPNATDAKPRMAIFGSDSIISDQFFEKASGEIQESHLDLFSGVVEWLRERPTSIGIKARPHTVFVLNPDKTDDWRLIFAPAVWTAVSILGLGIVVWVLRRS